MTKAKKKKERIEATPNYEVLLDSDIQDVRADLYEHRSYVEDELRVVSEELDNLRLENRRMATLAESLEAQLRNLRVAYNNHGHKMLGLMGSFPTNVERTN